MNTNIKALVEELKEVVMDLHRSAGCLDSIVQSIELETESPGTEEEFLMMFVKAQRLYRSDWKKATFKNVENKEDDIWKRLNQTMTKGES